MSFWKLGRQDSAMSRWILILVICSMLAAVLGFADFTAATAGIGKVLFFVFVSLTVLAVLVTFLVRRETLGVRRR